MYHTLDEFRTQWAFESEQTQHILEALTDASLAQRIDDAGGRTLGQLAWHITQTVPEMTNKTGLAVSGPGEHDPTPTSAAAIASAYKAASASLLAEIASKWSDASLTTENDMYGMTWTKAQTLNVVITHQAHHRGQMTVLMRQAGLRVPGIYGPAREDWAAMGMEPPPL
ncbi:DinB family protein [Gemmatimonas aurantiaca]|uniref:DinB family protein n=1 Tax=Gemmatimonas aurantiaca TaxID=173480 RepID=UPI00301BE7F5